MYIILNISTGAPGIYAHKNCSELLKYYKYSQTLFSTRRQVNRKIDSL